VDTDLGERIVQLRHEAPSHIVMPAIHLKKEQISELFHKELGTEAGNNDPTYLTHAARANLREHFLTADAGLTGVNFAIAETGGVVVCTNEGNADLGTSLPPFTLPAWAWKNHSQAGTPGRVHPPAGPLGHRFAGDDLYLALPPGRPGGEMHIVIVDNGRSDILGNEDFYQSLRCIRCGACMNTCPVYRAAAASATATSFPAPSVPPWAPAAT
jgi:L-lactate dehydrogenase complex protein LldF